MITYADNRDDSDIIHCLYLDPGYIRRKHKLYKRMLRTARHILKAFFVYAKGTEQL